MSFYDEKSNIIRAFSGFRAQKTDLLRGDFGQNGLLRLFFACPERDNTFRAFSGILRGILKGTRRQNIDFAIRSKPGEINMETIERETKLVEQAHDRLPEKEQCMIGWTQDG